VNLQPGDVIAVRTPPGRWWDRWASGLIRFGAALHGQDNLVDHVAIVHHTDPAGVLWGIEGRPGGVGWVEVARYDNRYLSSNAEQHKTDEQRAQVCLTAVGLLGTAYDWTAILGDAAAALRLNALWRERDPGDLAPGHVVCSSLAAWIYRKVGLTGPGSLGGNVLYVTPADWAEYFLSHGWH
jgi:hypothetical protein